MPKVSTIIGVLSVILHILLLFFVIVYSLFAISWLLVGEIGQSCWNTSFKLCYQSFISSVCSVLLLFFYSLFWSPEAIITTFNFLNSRFGHNFTYTEYDTNKRLFYRVLLIFFGFIESVDFVFAIGTGSELYKYLYFHLFATILFHICIFYFYDDKDLINPNTDYLLVESAQLSSTNSINNVVVSDKNLIFCGLILSHKISSSLDLVAVIIIIVLSVAQILASILLFFKLSNVEGESSVIIACLAMSISSFVLYLVIISFWIPSMSKHIRIACISEEYDILLVFLLLLDTLSKMWNLLL